MRGVDIAVATPFGQAAEPDSTVVGGLARRSSFIKLKSDMMTA
jgi:hypothetical protein